MLRPGEHMDSIELLYDVMLQSLVLQKRAKLMTEYKSALMREGFTREEAIELLHSEIQSGNFKLEVSY